MFALDRLMVVMPLEHVTEERKGKILLGIENCENNLSYSKNPIEQFMLTCSNIASLWSDSDLETQRKVQFLIFPEGIFGINRRCNIELLNAMNSLR